jgi:hypothetical protein
MEIYNLFIILLFVTIIIVLLSEKYCPNDDNNDLTEDYTSESISNEALGDVASVYNNNNFVATNVQSTGNMVANNFTATNGTVTNMNAPNFIGADIKLSKGWSGYPDNANDHAEISNDTGSFKKLMIVGNKSDGTGPRNIGMWDNVAVYGTFTTLGNVNTYGKLIGRQVNGVMAPDGYDIGGKQCGANAADCANYCANTYNNSLCAMYRNSTKECWCKNILSLGVTNSDYSTTLMI